MLSIENVSLNPPLLLVEREDKIINVGLNTVVVVKASIENKYKVGEKLLVEKTYLPPLEIDGETIEKIYYLNEQFVKGTVK